MSIIPKAIAGVVVLCACVALPACAGGPVFYETYEGANYESAGWRVATNEDAFNALNIQTFDSYSKGQDGTGRLTVTRARSTPSCDWSFLLKYTYAASGQIIRIESDFRTFTGLDPKTGMGGLTRCLRVFKVSSNETMTLVSEAVTDLTSGKKVDRTFFEPEIRHWMNIADLPKATAVWDNQPHSTTNSQFK